MNILRFNHGLTFNLRFLQTSRKIHFCFSQFPLQGIPVIQNLRSTPIQNQTSSSGLYIENSVHVSSKKTCPLLFHEKISHYEFLDFAFAFKLPRSWEIVENCSIENFITINALPEDQHAHMNQLKFSVNAFAYPDEIRDLDTFCLIADFLHSFVTLQRYCKILKPKSSTVLRCTPHSFNEGMIINPKITFRKSVLGQLQPYIELKKIRGVKISSCKLELQDLENPHRTKLAIIHAAVHPNKRYHYIYLSLWDKSGDYSEIESENVLREIMGTFECITRHSRREIQ